MSDKWCTTCALRDDCVMVMKIGGCKKYAPVVDGYRPTGAIDTSKPPRGGSALDAVHYQVGDKQPIEIMQDYLTHEQFVGFLRACALKYLLRMGRKDAPAKDADKAAQYAKWLSQAMRGERIKPMED